MILELLSTEVGSKGTVKAYCVMVIKEMGEGGEEEGEKKQTEVIKGQERFLWNETFSFDLEMAGKGVEGSVLWVGLFDSRVFGSDTKVFFFFFFLKIPYFFPTSSPFQTNQNRLETSPSLSISLKTEKDPKKQWK